MRSNNYIGFNFGPTHGPVQFNNDEPDQNFTSPAALSTSGAVSNLPLKGNLLASMIGELSVHSNVVPEEEFNSRNKSKTWVFGEEPNALNVTAAFTQQGNVKVFIQTQSKVEILKLEYFRDVANDTYRLDHPAVALSNFDMRSAPIHLATNLEQFIIGVWAAFVSIYRYSDANPLAFSKPSVTQQVSSASDEGRCMAHDLVCSNIPGISGDGKRMKLYTAPPCVRTVWVDLADCCREHDIALWCIRVDDEDAKSRVDDAVARCVARKVDEAVKDALPWWCWWLNPIQWIFDVIYNVMLIVARTGLIWAPSDANRAKYVGGGLNPLSCLCDPSGITTRRCPGGPNDEILCAQKCYKCWYKCNEEVDGRIVRGPLMMDPKGKMLCCPGYPKGLCSFKEPP
jgi:hypothetical protein